MLRPWLFDVTAATWLLHAAPRPPQLIGVLDAEASAMRWLAAVAWPSMQWT